MTRPRTRLRCLAGAAALLLVASACSSSSDDSDSDAGGASSSSAKKDGSPEDVGARTVATAADGALVLETTSTRAAYVSDGDVLVSLSGDAAPDAVVTVDGTDVSDAFTANGDIRRGLVMVSTARAPSRRSPATTPCAWW